jgi:hypothetical protein
VFHKALIPIIIEALGELVGDAKLLIELADKQEACLRC